MEDIAIKIEEISKKYSIGKEKDGSLRGTLNRLFKKNNSKSEDFWALKDVSFEVKKGEVIGIIGKNGAGKSTLLKILSQITKPTEGRIEINGRVASLLEVGTGFHPELTGRENIFLNGTILGMSRKEVKAKFDEIIEFSGIEKFIDTPVKHYSSGMYVRLAFAVAAHLEPEILIIDEVLAVGDTEFQKRCLGKMQDVANNGRTVIFVSHDLVAVKKLCSKGILLKDGRLDNFDSVDSIIDQYLSLNKINTQKLSEIKDRQGNGLIKFIDGYWVNSTENKKNKIKTLRNCELHLEFSTKINLKYTRIDIGINDSKENRIAWISSSLIDSREIITEKLLFTITNFNLAPGTYSCNLFCETRKEINDWIQLVLPFEIVRTDYYNSGKTIPKKQGAIIFDYTIN